MLVSALLHTTERVNDDPDRTWAFRRLAICRADRCLDRYIRGWRLSWLRAVLAAFEADAMSGLLTADEAAARLSISERTLRKLRMAGEIPYIAISGRIYRYTPEDCDAFLAERKRTDIPCPSQLKTHVRLTTNTTSKGRSGGFMELRAAQRSAKLRHSSTAS